MMIPKVINEAEKQEYPDGTYIKQYVVHAPEWDIYVPDEDGYVAIDMSGEVTSDKVDYFVISESTRVGYLETLVFPCNEEGKVERMIEIAGGRDYTADQVLTSFAVIMMEAGYDPV
tara:strand:- start:82 stop:429 length:348 start_codon:yes stop_codon:yes gene_type:complete